MAAISFLDGRTRRSPLAGGPSTEGPRLAAGEFIVAFSTDGDWLFVERWVAGGLRVDRVNAGTGQRETWKTLIPGDTSGVVLGFRARIVLDGDSYNFV